ncbi:MAG: cyclase family protein [Candidatus Izemoplasmatales bacterium]|nr:cyclase family protein [Candidatus Izemoplasmatales bacterium]
MIYDISMTIHPKMTVYKNKEEKYPKIKQVNFFDVQGNYESEITFNMHTGTHIDYPLHMLKNGENSNTENLETLTGKAKVFDLSMLEEKIDIKDIENLDIKENDFILFKTKNSFKEEFDFDFIYVNDKASDFLTKKKIRGIGIDALGIERNQSTYQTHKNLLSNKIIILEGLRLYDVPEGEYDFYCLPLKIASVEAVPVRAILIK